MGRREEVCLHHVLGGARAGSLASLASRDLRLGRGVLVRKVNSLAPNAGAFPFALLGRGLQSAAIWECKVSVFISKLKIAVTEERGMVLVVQVWVPRNLN